MFATASNPRPLRSNWAAMILVALAAGSLPVPCQAEPVVQIDFDGPKPLWRIQQDGPARVLKHAVTDDPDTPGNRCERIALVAPGGTSTHCSLPIGRAPVLDELRAMVRVRSNRPGTQLAAMVVLPRAIDPETGKPHTLLVRGPLYEQPGDWQTLELKALPASVKRQVRIMRLELERDVDHHEAFIEQLVLLVPGGPGQTELATDQLTVEGVLLSGSDSAHLDPPGFPASNIPESIVRVGWMDEERSVLVNTKRLPPRVQFQGVNILVDGQTFAPRVIERNGEPLEWLARLGFNGVLLSSLPTSAEQQEAEKLGLWFICPPPAPDELAEPDVAAANDYRAILGWYLDAKEAALPAGQLRARVEAIRKWDLEQNRPLLIAPTQVSLAHSRMADVVLVGRWMLPGDTARQDHAQWLSQQATQAGPGTKRWLRVEMLPDPAAQEQAEGLLTHATDLSMDERELEALARIALTAGYRGWLVMSGGPLDGKDPATQRRALALALVNSQLKLIEPWLTSGKVIGSATVSRADWTASVLQVERARLVVPLEWPGRSEAQSTSSAANVLELTVPGVPESNDAYQLTPAEITTLVDKRVAGGVQLSCSMASEGFVLLTEDPRALASLRQGVAREAARATQLRQQLAQARLAMLGSAPAGQQAPQSQTVATQRLQRAAQAYATRNVGMAYGEATLATRLVDDMLRQRIAALRQSRVLSSYPLPVTADTATAYSGFLGTVQTQGGPNLLYGGDFENLDQLTEFGWKHIRHQVPGVQTSAQLAARAPQHGQYSLVLSAMPDNNVTTAPATGPPLRIVTPEIPLREVGLVEISGWARINQPIESHSEALEISDTLGGEDLALHLRSTTGWQPFRIIRRVAEPGELRVTFALHGLGSAEIDAVMIRQLQVASGPTLAPATPAAAPAGMQGPLLSPPPQPATATKPQPLFDGPKLR